jgi:hypothetical protein
MVIDDLTRQLPLFGIPLPSETRNEQSLEIFKKNVKTYLYRIAYYDFM